VVEDFGRASLNIITYHSAMRAQMILAEIEDGHPWSKSFARSPDLLIKLAAETTTCAIDYMNWSC
jgi:hypothetical protein